MTLFYKCNHCHVVHYLFLACSLYPFRIFNVAGQKVVPGEKRGGAEKGGRWKEPNKAARRPLGLEVVFI